MSIAEYQVSLKNLIDATNDETVLKRWKAQLEGDLEHMREKNPAVKQESSLNERAQEPNSKKKDDTSNYVVIESGLGINE
jgi:hypothetical protein